MKNMTIKILLTTCLEALVAAAEETPPSALLVLNKVSPPGLPTV
jgi:hypothetical protein